MFRQSGLVGTCHSMSARWMFAGECVVIFSAFIHFCFLTTSNAGGHAVACPYETMNDLPQRKKIRLAGYDYSAAGAYLITICTKNKEYSFGDISDGKMTFSEIDIKANFWLAVSEHHSNIQLGEFVILPIHVHGILVLKETVSETWSGNAFSKPAFGSISIIINQYNAQ